MERVRPEAIESSTTSDGPDLSTRSTRELLGTYAAILRELVRRGVTRTLNAPAGDLAETLSAKVYDATLAPNSEKSWDLRSADGRLIQVKARVIASAAQTKPVQFSVFRSWGFDAALFVVFAAETYDILAAIEVPVSSVEAKSGATAWVGGSRLTVSLAVLRGLPGAVERTEEFAAALRSL